MAEQHTGGTTAQRTWIEATIIRADGTREPLGVICDSGLPERRPGLLARLAGWLK